MAASLDFPSLGNLPYELLHEIASYLRGQERIPKRFRVIYALSRVNKWLRCFALSILFRDISIPYWKLHSLLEYFSTQGACYAQHVRSIRFCPPSRPYRRSPGCFVPTFILGTSTEASIFPDLCSLNWPAGSGGRTPLVIDLAHRGLHHLSISYPVDQPFPPLERFIQLKSLRLFLAPELHYYFVPQVCGSLDAGFPSHPYPLLTTLFVRQQDSYRSPSQWPESAWRNLSFPNLKVLNLEYLSGLSPNEIYDFVQRHSTLMEVHVEFCFTRLRVEGIIKLILGTGTWTSTATQPTDGILGQHQATVNTVDRTEYDYFDGYRVPIADDIPNIYLCARTFGFVHEPITPDATEWRSLRGSDEARYRAISLAFRTPSLETRDDDEYEYESSVETFFQLAPYFPDLQELRIECQNAVNPQSSFTSCMAVIASLLDLWKNLKKLSMCFVFETDWRWYSSVHAPNLAERFDTGVLFLDEVVPPIESWEGVPHSINMLREEYDDREIDQIEQWVRIMFPYDEPIDLDDPFLILKCWQSLHHNTVTEVMSSLVDECPTLEEIEWYPTVPTVNRYSQGSFGLWKFKVHKGHSSSSRRMTTCRFTYPGSPQGDSPTFIVLVGEELARAEEARLWGR